MLKLEKFAYKDVSKVVSWVENKEFLLQWAGPSYKLELLEEQLKKEIEEMNKENCNNLMFSLKDFETNEVVGHIQLLVIDRENMSARIGKVIIGEKKYRNKGIGLQMINLVLDIAFNKLKLHRVDLGVFDFNVSAIECYKKAGFIIEGKSRECRKINGEYWSLINMSILEDEY